MSPRAVQLLALLLGLLPGELALKVQPSQGAPPPMAVPDEAKQLFVDLGCGMDGLEPKPDRLVVKVASDKKFYYDLKHKYSKNPGVVVAYVFLDVDPPPADALPMRLGKIPAAGWSNGTRDNETMAGNATAADDVDETMASNATAADDVDKTGAETKTETETDFSTATFGTHTALGTFLHALPLQRFNHKVNWLRIDLGDAGWRMAQQVGTALRMAKVIEVGGGHNAQINKWEPLMRGIGFKLDNCLPVQHGGARGDDYHCLWKRV